MKLTTQTLAVLLLASLIGLIAGRYWGLASINHEHMAMDHMQHMGDEREMFVGMKDQMIGEMIANEEYKCCLEKPCVYCIEKTPGHGEGATCSCLEDVVNGVHPCGECIGEILEGHGNRFLAKYFASAIAEEVGEEYKETIKSIISDKYDITKEDQI